MTDRSWAVPSAAPGLEPEDVAAVVRVLESGVLANGPEAAALEAEFAAWCGVPHAVAVSSGTAALVLAGQALGLSRGDVVLVAGFTFAATANAFLSLGCRVVPVDVDPLTFNVDPADLAAAADEHPAVAAVVVDLYGGTGGTDAAIDAARATGLAVIEDAAQAHGSRDRWGRRVGGRADATTFSLYATKNLAAGEGGLVTTPDPAVAERIRLLRSHGALEQYRHETVGLNHRLPEVAAALARVRLGRLEAGNAVRRRRAGQLARWCREAWGEELAVPPEAEAETTGPPAHVFHQFTVRFSDPERRDEVARRLRAEGVDARCFYPYMIGELPGVQRRPTPVAQRLRDTVLSLPVHPGLDEEQWERLRRAVLASALVGGGP